MSEGEKRSGKVVVVGDGSCGKTCLLEVFREKKFPETYIPTVVDNFVSEVDLKDKGCVSLELWDTAGQEDYCAIRPLSYNNADLIVLCYSIENDNDTTQKITKGWLMEIKNYCPTLDFFLVGLKKDVRNKDVKDSKPLLITEDEGRRIAKEISAKKFFECSALTGENVKVVFDEIAKQIWDMKDKSSKQTLPHEFSCCFLCC